MKAVNLIPADQRRGAGGLAGRSGGIVYVITAGLLAVVGLGIVYAFAVHSVSNRKTELADVTQQVAVVQAETQALAPYVAVASLRQERVAAVVSLAKSRFNWPTAMQQLALALPSNVTLTAFSATVDTTSSSSTAVAPSTTTIGTGPGFNLTGCADSQGQMAAILTRLAQVPGVDGVQLISASKSADTVPNSRSKQATLQSNASSGSRCPNVTFNVSVGYDATYTLPNQKLPGSSSSSAQTVSSSTPSKAVVPTTTAVNR